MLVAINTRTPQRNVSDALTISQSSTMVRELTFGGRPIICLLPRPWVTAFPRTFN